MIRHRHPLALLLATTLALTACAPAVAPSSVPVTGASAAPAVDLKSVREVLLGKRHDPGQAVAPAKYLAGGVSFGGPVAGATVTIIGPDGATVGSPLTTNEMGHFERPAEGLPATFTLKATGGKVGDRPLGFELEAWVNKLDARHDYFTISVASTVAAEAAGGNASVDLVDLMDRVENVLGLHFHKQAWLADSDLNTSVVEAEVAAAGSMDAWAKARVSELQLHEAMLSGAQNQNVPTRGSYHKSSVATDPDKIFKLQQATGIAGILASPGNFLATNLASGMVSAGGGMLFGMFLSAVGVSSSSDQVLSAIHALSQQVAVMEANLTNQLNALQTITIENGYTAQLNDGLGPILTAQDKMLGSLEVTANVYKADPRSAYAQSKKTELVSQIETMMFRPDDALAIWDRKLNGGALSISTLPDLYNRFIASRGPLAGEIWGPNEAQRMETWWDTVDAELAATAYLMVEYQNAKGNRDGAKEIIRRWADIRKKALGQLRGMKRRSDTIDLTLLGRGAETTAINNWTVQNAFVRRKYGFMILWTAHTLEGHKPADQLASELNAIVQGVRNGTGLQDWQLPVADHIAGFTEEANRPANLADSFAKIGLASSPGMSVWLANTAWPNNTNQYMNQWFTMISGIFTAYHDDLPVVYVVRPAGQMSTLPTH